MSDTLFDTHKNRLDCALEALSKRTYFSAFHEQPSPAHYGAQADADGLEAYQARLGHHFTDLHQHKPNLWAGSEISPYTGLSLGTSYPIFEADMLIEQGKAALEIWPFVSVEKRTGILLEALSRFEKHFFELAYATMHTTGQGFMMAFQASGPHAADRALEAIALGYEQLSRYDEHAIWEKNMGKYSIKIKKDWHAMPRGLNLAIGCSTFPTWNTLPGVFASLITGNPVMIKPHPSAVLPIALMVVQIQDVLVENGFGAGICQLAADTPEAPLAKILASDPQVRTIDYTGGPYLGEWLEKLTDKIVFTEKAGVNCVIMDSVVDIAAVVQNLAFSVCLYSGQMCTAPQNIFVPNAGISTPTGIVSFEEFADQLAAAITALSQNPKAGPFVLGCLQNPATKARLDALRKLVGPENVVLESTTISNPQFENAQTATTFVCKLESNQQDIFGQEWFGPALCLVRTHSLEESVELAQQLALTKGAISCAAYSTQTAVKQMISKQMAIGFTPVCFNLTGQIFMNQNAAFSDYHVSSGNPSGNATIADTAFVARRFAWIGTKEMV